MRSLLYQLARLLGDLNAVKRGRVASLLLFGGVTIALALLPAHADPPEDVQGWGKTEWGMHPKELIEAYPDDLVKKRGEEGGWIFTIEDYSLFGVPFTVRFFWDEGVSLSKVAIAADPVRADLSDTANKIVEALRHKFGPGKVVDQDQSVTELPALGSHPGSRRESNELKVRWTFDSTVITYNQSITTGTYPQPYTVSIVSIIYEPNEAGKF